MKEGGNVFLSAGAAVALVIIILVFITSAALTVVHAQTFTVLYNFGRVPGDGNGPQFGAIAQGRDGNLYAATSYGGSIGNCGTVFKITPTGTLAVLANLGGNSGCTPYCGLTLGRNGNFYGDY